MMTNGELKKKIAQIIADYFCSQRNEHKNLWGDDRLCYSKMNFAECERVAECTDALIAAGIGDVKTVREIGASAAAMAVFEAAKAEHRVEVAERALYNACKHFCQFIVPCPNNDCKRIFCNKQKYGCYHEYFLQKAEKELAEEGEDES